MKHIKAMRTVLGLSGFLVAALPEAILAQEDGLTVIIASDPQFNWWRGGDDPDCKDDCKEEKGKETNRDMVDAMNSILDLGLWPSGLKMGAGQTIRNPFGVIINGDLTAFWNHDELNAYKSQYSKDHLHYQVYPGLGNHDYENNVGDCVYRPLDYPDDNSCAKEAVWYMATQIDRKLPNVVSRHLDGFVAVENLGGFEARFTVKYKRGGETHKKESGNFPLLQWEVIDVPWDATDIEVEIEENTGLLDCCPSEPRWDEIETYDLSRAKAACYRLSGTTLDPDSEKIDCPQEWPNSSEGSLAYSFESGRFHFVQLQNRPDYEVDLPREVTVKEVLTYGHKSSPSFKVKDSYGWLKRDLADATRRGKHIIINMHDDGGSYEPEFLNAIQGQNVVAIFAGHYHEDYGFLDTVNNGVYDIPRFRSGSAECGKFLLVDLHRKYMNVAVVDTSGGSPSFVLKPEDVCDGRLSEYKDNDAHPVPQTFYINRPPDSVAGTLETPPAQEGRELSFRATGTDPDEDPLTFRWVFGDGVTAIGETVRHTYEDNGTYTVTVTADDGYEGLLSHSFDVTVANVPPALTANAAAVDENGTAAVSGSIFDPGIHDSFTFVINWGEGSPESIPLPAGTASFRASHQFLDDNPTGTPSDLYSWRADLIDKDGGTGFAVTEVPVRNVDPIARIDRIVDESGQELAEADAALVSLSLTIYESYSDPGTLDTRTAVRSWGEGLPSEDLGSVTAATSGSHIYPEPGTYDATVNVTDDDTGTGRASRTIYVLSQAEATRQAVELLASTTSSVRSAAASIEAALASLEGQNGGGAQGGALDLLGSPSQGAALEKLGQSIRSLQNAEDSDRGLDFTKLKSLLTLIVKSVTVEAVSRAEAAAANDAQRRKVADAQDAVKQGQDLLALRNYDEAVSRFRYAYNMIHSLR